MDFFRHYWWVMIGAAGMIVIAIFRLRSKRAQPTRNQV